MLSKGPPTATVICEYLDFKGVPNGNCDVKIFISKRPPTAILM